MKVIHYVIWRIILACTIYKVRCCVWKMDSSVYSIKIDYIYLCLFFKKMPFVNILRLKNASVAIRNVTMFGISAHCQRHPFLPSRSLILLLVKRWEKRKKEIWQNLISRLISSKLIVVYFKLIFPFFKNWNGHIFCCTKFCPRNNVALLNVFYTETTGYVYRKDVRYGIGDLICRFT